ncbi:hypothetical protein Q9189_004586 [Teloschistes chrysophthalmus]
MARRGVEVLLLLAGALLFFCCVTGREVPRSSQSAASSHLRRQNSIENHAIKTSTKIITLPFGNQNHSPNFSYPIPPLSHVKRDNADTYEYCPCKGRKLYTDIGLIAFGVQQGKGTTFIYDKFDSAWTTEPQTAWFEPTFNQWAQDTIGRSIRDDRVNRTKTVQNKAYTSVEGNQMPATGGSYEVLYIRSAGTIIAHSIVSPMNILTRRGVPDLTNAVPPLHRFSDIAWFLWTDILLRNDPSSGPPDTLFPNGNKAPNDPSRIQYLGHNLITNPTTNAVIDYIIADRMEGATHAPWPGVTLDVSEEDEGKALLWTPNGVGTAYFYMDHFRAMGKRRITVDIWSCSEEYPCMMWNLEDD